MLIGLCIILCGGLLPARAQQAISSATLSGQVEDAGGAVIAGATVTALNLEQNQTWTATTDRQGRYKFLYLPVGSYQLKLERTGFATVARQLTLTVGQALDVPIKLGVGALAARVDVIAATRAASAV